VKVQLFEYWNRLRSGFWFVPGIMTGAAVALAFATVALDESVTEKAWLADHTWAYTGGADGASLVLGTIAGSMITIAGVVFSMTLVTLSLAASQLGPRLLRNFMRDAKNQVVLGTFIATFVYCLLVLRSIRRAEEFLFVPHLSVTIGVVLALVSLVVLIYFIHHVAVSIQADEVVARVGAELNDGIDRLFPEGMGRGGPRPADELAGAGMPAAFDREARSVGAGEDGYLQSIDPQALIALATRENALFRLERRPGQYVVMGCPLVTVWPGDRVTKPLETSINSAFIVGNQRTATQDIEFPIHQLVEIAVRALSPGINDPFTAIACVDRLGSALRRLAHRQVPSPFRLDEQDQLRVVVPTVTFPEIVNASFGPIRQYARSSVVVTIRLLETIGAIAGATHRPNDRAALLRQAGMVVRAAREALPEDGDRQAVEECYRDASRALCESGEFHH
jgi:uncharacterized membrane protein